MQLWENFKKRLDWEMTWNMKHTISVEESKKENVEREEKDKLNKVRKNN